MRVFWPKSKSISIVNEPALVQAVEPANISFLNTSTSVSFGHVPEIVTGDVEKCWPFGGAVICAAGGFRKVRGQHQGLLPLSGKIMNCLKAKGDKALLSKPVLNILAAIGYDPKQEDPLKKLQVGKIVCLSDADPDGSHINCLINTLIARYLPGAYDAGLVYVADMPEFYSIVKDKIFTGDTLSEVNGKLKKAGVKGDVLHAKGWGEVDPQVLKILAVDPTRRLIKLNPLTDEDRSTFFSLMGKMDDSTPQEAE
jgi:DNA gyrase subunit B